MNKECKRCGKCCLEGGPSLHQEDVVLVGEDGVLGWDDLVTYRKGEPMLEQFQGKVVPLEEELVKIAPPSTGVDAKHPWICRYYGHGDGCTIHGNHPAECRVLLCADTVPLLRMYKQGRIDRSALIPAGSWLWGLVQEHEAQCTVQALDEAARTIHAAQGGVQEAGNTLATMIRYDTALRELLVEKGGMDASFLNFILGRPVESLLQYWGLRYDPKGIFVTGKIKF